MNNKGKITVFISLILMVMMSLIFAVLQAVSIRCARTKAVTATSSAASGIKAEYNEYIFERYHILLVDKDCYGYGEGMLEEKMKDSLEYNLSDEFSVEDVEISGTTGLLDNNCYEFKRQINDYIMYAAVDYSVDKIIAKTGENDKPVSDELLLLAENDKNTPLDQETVEQYTKSIMESINTKEDDPRGSLKIFAKLGIAYFIKPEEIQFSEKYIENVSEMPSFGHVGIGSLLSVATDFDDYSKLKKDVKMGNGWIDSLMTNSAAIAYAGSVFNCATDVKYDDTFFKCELEYILKGSQSDEKNYKGAVDDILALRLGVNFAYLLTDVKRMTEVSTLAFSISLVTFIPQPILKYLLAGCWAYIEGVAEVYFLLRGYDIPYIKTGKNWMTDLDSFGKFDKLKEPKDDEKGLSYKEYLLLLMAFNMDSAYYRMADVIELNTRQKHPDFHMKNAVTEIGFNVDIKYGNNEFSIRKEIGY